jgi:thiol-disulfide isomerase/thioredoxin
MTFLGVLPGLSAEDKPVMLFYYSNDCEHCINVKTDFLPGFLQKYGKHVAFVELEVSNVTYRDSLFVMESRLSIPESEKDYPAVYFMGTMLEGEIPVRLRLETLVKNYLSNPDSARKLDSEVMARIPEDVRPSSHGTEKTVYLAYFFKKGCKKCSRAEEIIQWMKSYYTLVEIDQFDVADKENKILAAALGIKTGVPKKRIMGTPVFFVGGDDYVLSESISRKHLGDIVRKYAKTGTKPVWRNMNAQELALARDFIEEQFRSFKLAAIALAGLGDGINPCAFATILFFVSYLGMVGRKRNEILITGLTFACAVFITYL